MRRRLHGRPAASDAPTQAQLQLNTDVGPAELLYFVATLGDFIVPNTLEQPCIVDLVNIIPKDEEGLLYPVDLSSVLLRMIDGGQELEESTCSRIYNQEDIVCTFRKPQSTTSNRHLIRSKASKSTTPLQLLLLEKYHASRPRQPFMCPRLYAFMNLPSNPEILVLLIS